jgi:hypothetical protein
MAFKNRLKAAANFASLSSMLTSLVYKSAEFAPQASRTYSNPDGSWSARGPWDADLVDHVHNEVQRFLDSGTLDPDRSAFLLNYRAGQRWLMGFFDLAAADQAASIELEQTFSRDPRILASKLKALQLMRAHRNPVDIL